MRGMKKSIKTSLIIIGLVLLVGLAGLVWLVSRPDEPIVSDKSRPSFAVNVEKPRMDRFLGGILPTRLEAKLTGGELRFDHASPGAKIGSVAHDRLELSADGWDLLIVTDEKGLVTSGTRLIFPIEIAEKKWTLRCRPADQTVGYFEATRRPSMSQSKSSNVLASDVLDGRFLIELAKCEDAATGKILDKEAGGNPGDAWPSQPLTLRGSFAGLPLGSPWIDLK
jgi:hypothetical protein